MFHSLQCTMVNPFVAESLVSFMFIEIMTNEYYKIGSLFFFKWIGFYRLIKLRFCMGQNAGYFNKANQRYSFFYSVLKKLPQK